MIVCVVWAADRMGKMVPTYEALQGPLCNLKDAEQLNVLVVSLKQ